MAEVKDLENVEQRSDRIRRHGGDAGGQRPAQRRPQRKPEEVPVADDAPEEAAADHPPGSSFWLMLARRWRWLLTSCWAARAAARDEAVTDVVQYGSITSTVEGSGLTKAKNSETITITTAGTVVDVLVTEGQKVTAGTPLFTVDSPAARDRRAEGPRAMWRAMRNSSPRPQKDIAGLNLSAAYAGKIMMETVTLNPGERRVTKGTEGGQSSPTIPGCGWSSITATPMPGDL